MSPGGGEEAYGATEGGLDWPWHLGLYVQFGVLASEGVLTWKGSRKESQEQLEGWETCLTVRIGGSPIFLAYPWLGGNFDHEQLVVHKEILESGGLLCSSQKQWDPLAGRVKQTNLYWK